MKFRCLAALLLWGVTASAPPLLAQEEAPPPILRGVVTDAGQPVTGVEVVLHRVSPLEAGEVDSVSTNLEGEFSFRLAAWPDPARTSEVHFASVRYQEILYFGGAVARGAQLDSLYVIEVFPSREAAGPQGGDTLVVEVRNVFLEAMDGDGWRVTDVIRVRNDGQATLVAPEGGETWRYPLPSEAVSFQVGESDLPEDAVDFRDGEVVVSAPVPPGDRIYVIRYTVPTLPIEFSLPGSTEVLEILVREPAPPLAVTGLEAAGAMELEPGTVYRVWGGSELQDQQVTVEAGEEPSELPVREMVVVLGLLLALLGGILVQRRIANDPTPAAPSVAQGRREILLDVARLDDAFEASPSPSPREEAEYRRRRAELLGRLNPAGSDASVGSE
ncbi:MAG: carboxypeptidase-like regulatory domain-containing protein [Gemmatimonadota bacterium]